jgi:hypothetical protein
MRNASQRKDIRRAEKLSAERDRAEIEFVVNAMSTVAGRVWFHHKLSICNIFNDPFTGDSLMDNFIKGQRNIGLLLYNTIVTNCPDHFVTMMKEAAILEQLNDRRSQSSSSDSDDVDEFGDSSDTDGRDN